MILKAACAGSTVDVEVDPATWARFSGVSLSVGSHGYAQYWDGSTVVLLHRTILGLKKGDGMIADHVNGNRLDNRRSNLRAVSASGSSQNVSGRGSSGRRGVYPTRSGKWAARVKFKGKMHYLGTFDDPDVAYKVSKDWRVANMPDFVDRP